jgi:hypothetical protein
MLGGTPKLGDKHNKRLMLGMDIHKNDEFHFTIGEVLSCIGAGTAVT